MEFGLTETQQVLKNSARRFFPAECPMADVRRLMETDTAHDERLWRSMTEQGWPGIITPEEFGGMGLGLVELAVAMEEMGRALVPGPYLATLLAAGAIEASANDAARSKYLREIAAGRKASLALLEESASWDPDAVQMPLQGTQLRGRKLFVSDAAVADLLVCAARSGSELVLAMVESGAPGLSFRSTPGIDLTRRLYEVTFAGVEAAVIATGDPARSALDRALDVATVGLVAEMVGGMQRVLEIAVEYAKTRKQFGKPIGQYQAVQHMCADMLVWTESSRSAAYYAAWALNEQLPEAPAAVSVAKAYASDACREVGNRGIQVQGGMGFTWENDVHLYFRRAKASEICFGDATYHRERIARIVIDGARSRTAQA